MASGTPKAIVDYERWPATPHNGNGTNPYAWTNYQSAQRFGIGDDKLSYIQFDWDRQRDVRDVVVYYFVDSWSASLPKDVDIQAYDQNKQIVPVSMNYREPVQMSGTCWKQVYHLNETVSCQTLRLGFASDDTSKKQGNIRCVGVYEIEIYGHDSDMRNWEDGYEQSFYAPGAGSTEYTRKRLDTIRVMDGDPNTIWHTNWDGCAPEDMYLEFERVRAASPCVGIRVLPRSGNQSGDNNGRIAAYEVQEYNDSTGTWQTLTSGRWDDSEGWKEARWDDNPLYTEAGEGRRIRLVATETYGVTPNKWMSAAEVEFIIKKNPSWY